MYEKNIPIQRGYCMMIRDIQTSTCTMEKLHSKIETYTNYLKANFNAMLIYLYLSYLT